MIEYARGLRLAVDCHRAVREFMDHWGLPDAHYEGIFESLDYRLGSDLRKRLQPPLVGCLGPDDDPLEHAKDEWRRLGKEFEAWRNRALQARPGAGRPPVSALQAEEFRQLLGQAVRHLLNQGRRVTAEAVAGYFDQSEAVSGNSMLWADHVGARRLRQWSKDLLSMALRQALDEAIEVVKGAK